MSYFRGTAYINKHIKKRDEQRNRNFHSTHLKNMRPVTSNLQQRQDSHWINNRKKEMIIQDRFTEIQKANRILLEKITDIMGKKRNISTASNTRMNNNKSLNSSIRRKQMQNIEIQNAKLLKRLQQKKSSYQTQKFNQNWQKQKKVISNLANYPFIISDRKRFNEKKNSFNSFEVKDKNKQINHRIQLCRMKIIDSTNFLITIRLNQQKLQIIGDTRKKQQVKIIQIQRNQALDFIDNQCNGKIQLLFQKLKFDRNQDVLYLVGQDVDIQNGLQPYQREKQFSKQKKKNLNTRKDQNEKTILNNVNDINQRDQQTDRKRQNKNQSNYEEKIQFQQREIQKQQQNENRNQSEIILPVKKPSEWIAKQVKNSDDQHEDYDQQQEKPIEEVNQSYKQQ